MFRLTQAIVKYTCAKNEPRICIHIVTIEKIVEETEKLFFVENFETKWTFFEDHSKKYSEPNLMVDVLS